MQFEHFSGRKLWNVSNVLKNINEVFYCNFFFPSFLGYHYKAYH